MSDSEPIIINGKRYPMWESFVHGKDKFIGRVLTDTDSDPLLQEPSPPTKLIDIKLEPNGQGSAWIEFVGEDYSCGYDVGHCGIRADGDTLHIHGYGGMGCKIEKVGKSR